MLDKQHAGLVRFFKFSWESNLSSFVRKRVIEIKKTSSPLKNDSSKVNVPTRRTKQEASADRCSLRMLPLTNI